MGYVNLIPVGFVQRYPSFSSVSMKRIYILNDLFVDSAYRGKGYASLLIQKACEYAGEQGIYKLELKTQIINTKARALYTKLGWEQDTKFCSYAKIIPKPEKN